MTQVPKLNHEHDCELCAYLGSFYSARRRVPMDCYFCGGSLLMRFSSSQAEYESFPINTARYLVGESADWKRLVDLYDAFVMEGDARCL